jgi:hypothetical protein
VKLYRWNKPLLGCVTLVVLLALSAPAGAQLDAQQPGPPQLDCLASGHDAVEAPFGVSDSDDPVLQAREYRLPNGLHVFLYDSEELASRLDWIDGEPTIPLDDGRYVKVIADIEDPSIYNKGDGSFHPFPEDAGIEVLKAISHPNLNLELVVYLLPYPRRGLLVSSTSDNVVFLSPHVLEIPSVVCAYIVAHEMGHVFHNAYMPDGSGLWDRYRRIRGITDTEKYSDTSSHAYRPKEIFAEDFRVMFGGPDAAFGGQVENPGLESPLTVSGLEVFVERIGGTPVALYPKVAASSYPNPFNPETEIRIVLPDELADAHERVTVRIYDVRGALVRELYSDVPFGSSLYVRWDGRDQSGSQVASSNYFAMIEAGGARTTLKLVLLK